MRLLALALAAALLAGCGGTPGDPPAAAPELSPPRRGHLKVVR